MSTISSSSSSSSWQHIQVNTDKITSQLKIFVSVLEQTRDPLKFNLWKKSTIIKAFKWADIINKLSKTSDQIQQDNIAKELKLINISFIDKVFYYNNNKFNYIKPNYYIKYQYIGLYKSFNRTSRNNINSDIIKPYNIME
jgi:hypothetical protein